jgi:hypothetical protein
MNTNSHELMDIDGASVAEAVEAGRGGRQRGIGGGDFVFHTSDSKEATNSKGSHRVRQESPGIRLSAMRKCLGPNGSFGSASPSFAYFKKAF